MKWGNPIDWLAWKVQQETVCVEPCFLKGVLSSILDLLDVDDVQRVFQAEMDEDGYFDSEGGEMNEKC